MTAEARGGGGRGVYVPETLLLRRSGQSAGVSSFGPSEVLGGVAKAWVKCAWPIRLGLRYNVPLRPTLATVKCLVFGSSSTLGLSVASTLLDTRVISVLSFAALIAPVCACLGNSGCVLLSRVIRTGGREACEPACLRFLEGALRSISSHWHQTVFHEI